MSLNIEAMWSRPIGLRLARFGATDPRVYIFGREHGEAAAPLYIGKALNLRRRIEQQLNSVRLMKGILEAQSGARFVIYCVPQLKRGQAVPSQALRPREKPRGRALTGLTLGGT